MDIPRTEVARGWWEGEDEGELLAFSLGWQAPSVFE